MHALVLFGFQRHVLTSVEKRRQRCSPLSWEHICMLDELAIVETLSFGYIKVRISDSMYSLFSSDTSLYVNIVAI